jgi:hypothetical protein
MAWQKGEARRMDNMEIDPIIVVISLAAVYIFSLLVFLGLKKLFKLLLN